MSENYIPWPAEKEEFIKITVHNGNSPISPHMHDFIEIVFIAHGSCHHSYHKTEMLLIPGDVFVVLPHEEHSYSMDSKTIIYNCLFYPEIFGDDWNNLKEIKGIQNVLMVEPFYRIEQGNQEILHLSPVETSYIESILKKMVEEQVNEGSGYRLVQKASLMITSFHAGKSVGETIQRK